MSLETEMSKLTAEIAELRAAVGQLAMLLGTTNRPAPVVINTETTEAQSAEVAKQAEVVTTPTPPPQERPAPTSDAVPSCADVMDYAVKLSRKIGPEFTKQFKPVLEANGLRKLSDISDATVAAVYSALLNIEVQNNG